ncbi:SDR family NAD(P)-dependent oxidoreductase [Hirschia litorea]|uniref:SDR family NAD(P)-dependent oxidoreductase n=1 Tax=Hirschia litorea TaxID=1199156 RepID=A0ABW2IQI2_9PROT
MSDSVIITGAQGGIGAALCKAFKDEGWFVIATGRNAASDMDAQLFDAFIIADLNEIATSPDKAAQFKQDVEKHTDAHPLKALVNNAAIQILGRTEDLKPEDLTLSFNVNVLAPFMLTQQFLPALTAQNGSVLNIGTVHAQSTKAEFPAYATTKTAMHGLTRALAVDLGGRVRVNTLAPAATETPMLKAGFEGKPEAYQALAQAHPIGRIADVSEIAQAALFLCSDKASFITGSTLYADGGVLSRLHDPA